MEHVYRHACSVLFGVKVEAVEYVAKRSKDLQEVSLKVDGEEKLRFALVGHANGPCALARDTWTLPAHIS